MNLALAEAEKNISNVTGDEFLFFYILDLEVVVSRF